MSKSITTKENILKQSKRLFSQYGFASTSTQMIADEVGIKKPSLYHYFKNKESIYISLLESTITEIEILFAQTLGVRRSFEEKLKILFEISKNDGSFIFSVHTLREESLIHITNLSKGMSKTMLKYLSGQKLNCQPKEALTLICDITQNYARRAAQGEKTMSPKRYSQLLISLLS